jgi:hypothetical protein
MGVRLQSRLHRLKKSLLGNAVVNSPNLRQIEVEDLSANYTTLEAAAMIDRAKLPANVTTGNVMLPAEQSGSLVTRGLEAVKDRQKTLLLVNLEADAGKLFRTASDAYRRGDFAEAVNLFRKAVDQSHARAQIQSWLDAQ